MNAIEAIGTDVTYLLNGRSLSGATGLLYGRVAMDVGESLTPLDRLALRLSVPLPHYKMLHRQFLRRETFPFEIHQGLVVRLSTRAVISELLRKPDHVACLVEFNLLLTGGGGTTRRLLGGAQNRSQTETRFFPYCTLKLSQIP